MSQPNTIEFFFDIASPYSYLASTQVEGLSARTGAAVRWRPFLLGGVFRAVGNTPPVALAARQPYLLKDLYRWAAHYGVPFNFPSFFPVNSLVPMRALAGLPEAEVPAAAAALFRAHWAEERDPSDAAVLTDLLGAERVALASAGEVKAALRETTDEAVRRGAFGAPTFFVGDEMFFGNDRLHFVEAAARG